MTGKTAGADIAIIGGGVIGSSVAYNLLSMGFGGKVLVLERDPAYRRASSRLAFGGVRQQYCCEINVRMAQMSVAFYERFDETMGVGARAAAGKFRQRGYLFLGDRDSTARLLERLARMRAAGAIVEPLTVEEIRERVPELDVSDVELGIFGRKDGYGDPSAILGGFRAKAESLGAKFLADELTGVERDGRVRAIATRGAGRIETSRLVCAAGAFSARVGGMAGVSIPVTPVRQQLVRAVLPRPWSYEFPVVIDPSGIHWRSAEANTIVIAKTEAAEPPGERFEADEDLFAREWKPLLARRVPEFAGLEQAAAWAGLYEMTPDQNGLLGEHPDLPGLHLACGFSGHGLMMAPATGQLVAQSLLGLPLSLDIGPLSIARFAQGRPLLDDAMI
ncbi:MAG: NAD(P)/FAD-dependent oxidoreductase [Thermoanaerobaculia bacterium]